jgi:hypothetical protein
MLKYLLDLVRRLRTGPSPRTAPRGLEALLQKAAREPAFCERLLEKRSGAAPEAGVELDPAEAAMLDGSPREQLKAMIAGASSPASARIVAFRTGRARGGIRPDHVPPERPDDS